MNIDCGKVYEEALDTTTARLMVNDVTAAKETSTAVEQHAAGYIVVEIPIYCNLLRLMLIYVLQ